MNTENYDENIKMRCTDYVPILGMISYSNRNPITESTPTEIVNIIDRNLNKLTAANSVYVVMGVAAVASLDSLLSQ
tara:strand:- start:1168 stop:1395 length:228 start_codon:yes stop_codon:yes gene_type:complete